MRRALPAVLLAVLAWAAPAALAGDAATAGPDRVSLVAGTDVAPDAAPDQASASPRPCPARDPEDGRCYPSADAADRAWLKRGPAAGSPVLEDDDEDEGEEAVEPLSFWRSVGERLRGLVVRRSDGKPVAVPDDEIEALFATRFPLPIESYDRAKLHDSFLARRGKKKKHFAIDLGAPRGTPVVAVADGVIERLGRDRRGGKVVYLRDVTGRFTFYYAHLRVHEKGLHAGDQVVKGQLLGEVGATGRVVGGPHLHFAIYRNQEATGPRLFVVNPYLIFSTLLPR